MCVSICLLCFRPFLSYCTCIFLVTVIIGSQCSLKWNSILCFFIKDGPHQYHLAWHVATLSYNSLFHVHVPLGWASWGGLSAQLKCRTFVAVHLNMLFWKINFVWTVCRARQFHQHTNVTVYLINYGEPGTEWKPTALATFQHRNKIMWLWTMHF